ncbi:MAG TPA: hypothetical protein PLU30_06930 [Verrucomicrobiae bacterium]|nr:hypothetical protein [Verrucomicrobiae bacterium]
MSEIFDPGSEEAERLRRQKHILLGVILLLSCAFGVLNSIYASTSGWETASFILDTLSFSLCLSAWCACDAHLRGSRLGRGLRWTIILFALVGFPMYAFRSRGRHGWSLLGLGALFFLLQAAASVGSEWLTDIVRGASG